MNKYVLLGGCIGLIFVTTFQSLMHHREATTACLSASLVIFVIWLAHVVKEDKAD